MTFFLIVRRGIGCQILSKKSSQSVVFIGHPLVARPHIAVLRHHEPIAHIVHQVFRLSAGNMFLNDSPESVVQEYITILFREIVRKPIVRRCIQQIGAFGRDDPGQTIIIIIDISCDNMAIRTIVQLRILIDQTSRFISICNHNGTVFIYCLQSRKRILGIITVCNESVAGFVHIQT